MSAPSFPTTDPSSTPQQPAQRPANGFGITALVLGILTLAGFAVPVLNYVTIVTGLAAVVFGIVGLVVKFRPRKAAVAGLITGGLGLILSIILAVVYTAAFAGAAKAISDTATIATATPAAGAAGTSDDDTAAADASFTDGKLTTPDMTITITANKVIPVGQAGNEYGDKPVMAFWYDTTNLTDKQLDPSTAFIMAFTAYQDNNPNAENKLDVGMLPDEAFLDSQTENIKKGGTVSNAVAFELDDETTPVELVAADLFGTEKIGSQTYAVK